MVNYYWVMIMEYKKIKALIIRYWKVILIIFTLIIFIIGFILVIMNQNNIEEENGEVIITKQEVEEGNELIEKITIDIKGAVKNPGVYIIESNKRVIDAIELAGGLLDNADNSVINLSKKLKDEMVIIIYTKDEIKEMLKGDTSIKVIEKECICPQIKNDACVDDNKVDNMVEDSINYPISINNAGIKELMNLPGIGESKAKAIVEYREKNGNFENIEDITKVSGIGESLFEQIKEYIDL